MLTIVNGLSFGIILGGALVVMLGDAFGWFPVVIGVVGFLVSIKGLPTWVLYKTEE